MAQAVQPRTGSPAPTTPAPSRPKAKRKVPFLVDFYRSALGKKYVMALTGIVFMLYVLLHMVGNLKMFYGPEELNEYSEFLRNILYPILPHSGFLWLFRLLLIVSLVLHVQAAYALTLMNRRARPTK